MRASVARAQPIEEAGGWRVDVEATDRVGVGRAETVDAVARSGQKRARADDVRLVAHAEFNLAFEDVERVNVVGVGVGIDALELGLEGHVDHGELRQVAKDSVRAHGAAEGLGAVRLGEDRVGERTPAVEGRFVLVEARVGATNVVTEPARGSVEVEKDRVRVAGISEGMDDVWRRGGEGARSRADRLGLWAERDFDLALEDVEGIGVVVMDVGVRPLLAGRVAEPRHDHVVEVGEDPEGLLRPIGDRLALAGC